VEGCDRNNYAKGMCASHYLHARRTSKSPTGKVRPIGVFAERVDPRSGYIYQGSPGVKPRLKHRLVMEQLLGRPLLPSENVHHVNGQRDDNRLDNLELWSKSQPAGQRVADKVAWAIEFLALYQPDALSTRHIQLNLQ
jgi:hypothetical protein